MAEMMGITIGDIGGLLPQLKAGFFQRQLFRQRYVCLYRRGHPMAKKKISLADFRAAEHLVVVSAGTGHGAVDDLLRRSGVDRVVRLTVPHFVGVGHILRSTDLVATVPERLARELAEPFDLAFGAACPKLRSMSSGTRRPIARWQTNGCEAWCSSYSRMVAPFGMFDARRSRQSPAARAG
jgi:DNA-binding transcriptional LysR family regulator